MSKQRTANELLDQAAPSPKSKRNTVEASTGKGVSTDEKSKRRAPFFGLVKRKEKWTLSFRGWLVSLAAAAILGGALVLWVHPFLAVTDRVDTQYLVIEGWVPNYVLEESIAEFKARPYTMIFTVGADPLTGVNVEPGDSVATEAAKRLKWLGMSPDLVKAVPAHIKYRNRTFQSAYALKQWSEENHVPMTSLNVVTLGAHARRSRLLFDEAFEWHTRIGIIAVQNREYEPKRWWKYSEGVREVIGEMIGYMYARFVFHPNK